jgi:hypothetical protein
MITTTTMISISVNPFARELLRITSPGAFLAIYTIQMNGRLKNWLKGGALFSALDVALVAALAATCAYWTWAFVAPPSVAASAHASASQAASPERPLERNLFGAGGAAPGGASLKLVGVASPRHPDDGRAVFVLDNGRSKAARTGESIVPGVTLREVHPDHVLVERGGAMERLTLERRNGGR